MCRRASNNVPSTADDIQLNLPHGTVTKTNKMQSEMADFALVLPFCEVDETYASCLILHIRSITRKHDVIHKTGST